MIYLTKPLCPQCLVNHVFHSFQSFMLGSKTYFVFMIQQYKLDVNFTALMPYEFFIIQEDILALNFNIQPFYIMENIMLSLTMRLQQTFISVPVSVFKGNLIFRFDIIMGSLHSEFN